MAATNKRSASTGSDYELCYASPIIESQQPRDRKTFSDEEGKLEDDGRKRRSRGSSEDDEDDGHDHEEDDEDKGSVWDGFCNEDLRTGGPYLCPLPARITGLSPLHPLRSRILGHGPAESLKEEIFSILTRNDVAFGERFVVEEVYDFRPQDGGTVTLSISASRSKKDSKWVDAAREVKAFLNGHGLTDVAVEIADPEAFVHGRTFPVETTHPLFNLWDRVRDSILDTIDLDDVQVVGCYRFGKSPKAVENPPTVLILVKVESTRLWRTTREQIVEILEGFGLGSVAVAIYKDRIFESVLQFSPAKSINRRVLAGPAVIGQSLGLEGQTETSGAGGGTLGGFLELLDQKSKEWRVYALTCFHCVVPRLREDDLDRYGYTSSDRQCK